MDNETTANVLGLLDIVIHEVASSRDDIRRLDVKVTSLDARVEGLDRRLGRLETRVEGVETELRSFRHEFERQIVPLESA